MVCASSTKLADGPQAWLINNGTRLHLQHGPIDLIIDAVGAHDQVRQAYSQAVVAFETVLDSLASQLPLLRKVIDASNPQQLNSSQFLGAVAQRMYAAAMPFSMHRVTPMIAVAGAVANHILDVMLCGRELQRVQVNNGGDIALYLSPGASTRIGVCSDPSSDAHTDVITLQHESGIGGIATSGWQGRSYSLGIANACTVLAADAACADAAATLIANHIDLPGSKKIQRVPANELSPDSDLTDRLVTVAVGQLTDEQRTQALQSGVDCALDFYDRGLIQSAYLHLQGQTQVVGAEQPLNRLPMGCRS